MKKSFRDLYVWNASVDLAVKVCLLCDDLIDKRRFGLADQLQRAAVSVPSNIAEGQGRLSRREWRQFLAIARGSLFELETQLEILTRVRLLSADEAEHLRALTARISYGLTRLIATLS